MRKIANETTLEKAYTDLWLHRINEYETVKSKQHPRYKFVTDFYKSIQMPRQTFLKYYHRYQKLQHVEAFIPKKRGPIWKTRRPDAAIEAAVLAIRETGASRYEVHAQLTSLYAEHTPSPSGVYNIFKRGGVNRKKHKMKQEFQCIIKERAGEMGHIDCHYLPRNIIADDSKRYYLVCVLDACTRLAWAEVVEDIKSFTVMFATLRSFNFLNKRYQIQFEEVLTDNGAEFSSPKKKESHPFERMLQELGIKHRYTKPYRPQTNGKVERFWRTLNEDMIDNNYFDSIDHLKRELAEYLFYYNEFRPHQGVKGTIPKTFLEQINANAKS